MCELKLEAIKKAWAGFYNPQVNMENGWMDIRPGTYSNDQFFDRIKFNDKKHSIRPKTLSGLDNNNGWIKIENESDLPKDGNIRYFHYHLPSKERMIAMDIRLESYTFEAIKNLHSAGLCTHYKPIEQPHPPIY